MSVARALRRCVVLTLLGVGLATAAAPTDPDDQALAAARQQIDQIGKDLQDSDASLEALAGQRDSAAEIQASTSAIADRLEQPVANVAAQLTQLGPAPADKATEAPRIGAERKSLQDQLDRLSSQQKLAKLISVESQQTVEQIDKLRRTRFAARLGERTKSLFAVPFWTELVASWRHDRPRLGELAAGFRTAAAQAPFWSWLVAVVLTIVLVGAVHPVHRLAQRFAAKRLPTGRIRRSLLALVRTIVPTLFAWIGTRALLFALDSGSPTSAVMSFATIVANGLTFGVYIGALGRALASANRPTWRLADMPDPVAHALRNEPTYLGVIIAISMSLERLASLLGSSLSTTISINGLTALGLAVVLARTARRGEHARRTMLSSDKADQVPPRSLVSLVLIVGAWGVIATSIVCIALGYVALGRLLVSQVAWVMIVGITTYLIVAVIDDASEAWLGGQTTTGDDGVEATPTARRQASILVSGASRVIFSVIALTLMLAPLGQDPDQLVQRAEGLSDGIVIGEIRILPVSIVQALVILAIGIFAVRALQHWLLERYLPTTHLDAGMRSSTATLLGYVGFVIAVALSLSALGIGVERVAWIASALSVGIGFGLQAVVQNFVSGLILLTERPVKVGDWVALGGVEGDIRRINVRATEIQMGDRSTVIVPNSEFITKVVRNVTMGSPMGLVQIKLPLPMDTDVEKARTLLLECLSGHEDIADAPAPSVLLDAIDQGRLVMIGTGSVTSPRQVGNVRSALLFDVLARFREAGIVLSPPATVMMQAPPVPGASPPVPVGPAS